MNTEMEIVRQGVRKAGHRVLELQKAGFQTYRKEDHSPVTSADLEVDRILKEALLQAFPKDGWLSEETPDDPQRLEKTRVWVVDPIDGTKYFMKGIPQFSISVALVENQQPVLAVVYNPATDEMFSAIREAGAHLNDETISVKRSPTDPLKILVNPSRLQRGEFRAYEGLADCQPMGSIAYTLALVAAGQADAALNFDLLHEWDVVAGWLLVKESGGVAVDSQWNPVSFNQHKTSVHGILAMPQEAREQVKNLIHRASHESD